MIPACLEDRGPHSVQLRVKVVARATRTEVAGLQGTASKTRVAAPPVDDADNTAEVSCLADLLRLPGAAGRLTCGRTHP